MGLVNALLAGALALAALAVGRLSRRPALVHSLWVLVLLKLVTPPLVSLPVPGWEVVEPADAFEQLADEPTAEPAPEGQFVRAALPTASRPEERPVMKVEDFVLEAPRPAMPADPVAVLAPDDPPAVTLLSEPAEQQVTPAAPA